MNMNSGKSIVFNSGKDIEICDRYSLPVNENHLDDLKDVTCFYFSGGMPEEGQISAGDINLPLGQFLGSKYYQSLSHDGLHKYKKLGIAPMFAFLVKGCHEEETPKDIVV